MARIDRDELRVLVRQALKDALAGGGAPPPAGQPPTPAARQPVSGLAAELRAALARGRPARVAVAARTPADLGRFAQGILDSVEHPDLRAAITAGDIRFEVGHGAPEPPPAAEKPTVRGDAFQMKSGVLSETRIVEIARTHRKIVIGSDVVLTPLARDKARAMKVELVRQKP